MSRNAWGKLALVPALLAAACPLAGCRRIGPGTIPRDRISYGSSISDSWKRQTLLNLVKIRYADSPVFMDIGQIVASYNLSEDASVAAGWRGHGKEFPFETFAASASGHYSESPTVTYSPLTGQSFVRGLMTPLRPESMLLIIQSGWPVDSVLLTTVRSINGLQNQTYSTNGGMAANPDFIRAVNLLRSLQLCDLAEFRIAPKEKDSGELTFFICLKTAGISEQAAREEEEFRRLLRLKPGANEYKLVWGSQPADDTEMAIQTRSVLQVLAVISLQAQVPEEHVKEGRATPGTCPNPTDPERVIRVRSGKEPPADAYAAVNYHGYWFWIDDKDLQSKRTFSFLLLLFSLVDTGAQPPAPVITIPAR